MKLHGGGPTLFSTSCFCTCADKGTPGTAELAARQSGAGDAHSTSEISEGVGSGGHDVAEIKRLHGEVQYVGYKTIVGGRPGDGNEEQLEVVQAREEAVEEAAEPGEGEGVVVGGGDGEEGVEEVGHVGVEEVDLVGSDHVGVGEGGEGSAASGMAAKGEDGAAEEGGEVGLCPALTGGGWHFPSTRKEGRSEI